jgi:hypothetical protein
LNCFAPASSSSSPASSIAWRTRPALPPSRRQGSSKSLWSFYPNTSWAFSTFYGHPSYICQRNRRPTMYDALLVIMGLVMFAAFLAYAAACEKM